MKTKKLIKLLILIPCLLVIIVTAAFFIAEEIMCRRITATLRREYGDNYAILRLHMGGVPAEKPSLWRMLNLAYEYRYSGNYEPQGTANITGKQNYLILMLSDNQTVAFANWSFIDFDLDMSEINPMPWDVLDNLPEKAADYYRYNPENRIRRCGLWFTGDSFNNPDTDFYYRPIARDKEQMLQRCRSLGELGDIEVEHIIYDSPSGDEERLSLALYSNKIIFAKTHRVPGPFVRNDLSVHEHYTGFDLRQGDDTVFTGAWSDTGEDPTITKTSSGEKWQLVQIIHGGLEHKYCVASILDAGLMERTAYEFKQAVLHGNKERVAVMISYPVDVSLKNGERRNIRDSERFLGMYDRIFYPEFVEAFKEADPLALFANLKGIMMSSPDNTFWVWFGNTRKHGPRAHAIYSSYERMLDLQGD